MTIPDSLIYMYGNRPQASSFGAGGQSGTGFVPFWDALNQKQSRSLGLNTNFQNLNNNNNFGFSLAQNPYENLMFLMMLKNANQGLYNNSSGQSVNPYESYLASGLDDNIDDSEEWQDLYRYKHSQDGTKVEKPEKIELIEDKEITDYLKNESETKSESKTDSKSESKSKSASSEEEQAQKEAEKSFNKLNDVLNAATVGAPIGKFAYDKTFKYRKGLDTKTWRFINNKPAVHEHKSLIKKTSAESLRAEKAFNSFDIEKHPENAEKWLEHVKNKKHFDEYNNLDDLKKAYKEGKISDAKKADVEKFLKQVNEAEEIAKRQKTINPDAKTVKVQNDEILTKHDNALNKVKELEKQLKTAKGDAKKDIKIELKKAKQELKETTKEFKQTAVKAKENVLKIANSTKDELTKISKEVSSMDDIKKINAHIEEKIAFAKKTGNKTLEDALLKIQKNVTDKPPKTGFFSKSAGKQVASTIESEGTNCVKVAEKLGKSLEYVSKYKGALKAGGWVLTAAVEGASVYSAFKESDKKGWKQVMKSAGGVAGAIGAGALAGGAIGAVVGSVVPVAGTAVGWVVGAVLGLAVGAAGYYLGSKAGEEIGDATLGED